MRRTLLVVASLLVGMIALVQPLSHPALAAPFADPKKPDSQGVLCLPGVYLIDPGDCSPAGASAYLTRMAEKGLTFPVAPLPSHAPDPALNNIDFKYVRVDANRVPVYSTLEDANSGDKKRASRWIEAPTLTYISYAEETYIGNKRFYRLESGEWLTTVGVTRIGAVPRFQGLEFTSTPNTTFGWVLSYLSNGPVETKHTPGYAVSDYTGHVLQNHEMVYVYAEQTVDDIAWYLVGPDEWLPHTLVARVIPNTTPPLNLETDRWIEVNLYERTVSIYEDHQLVFATLIASGLEPFWTRPGLFQIKTKLTSTPMRGAFEADRSDAYFLDNVPWTMYFDEARALHGAYWRTQLGYPQSHGCVNLSVADAHWIFDWAKEGDWVYVWDPSGKTPEDPKLYSAGGA